MSVKRETTTARRRLEFILRAAVRLLATPGTSSKDINTAIEKLLERVGPGEGDLDVLGELIRRGERSARDGYPSQSMADSDIHGGFAQTGDTSTERAAMAWASPSDEEAAARGEPVKPDDPDQEMRDVAADALRELVLNIDGAATFIGDADRTRKFLLSIQRRQHDPDEQVIDKCALCEAVVTNVGSDRLKSLYCPKCYEAWRRAGAPRDPVERRRFERERLAWLKERDTRQGHVECPHICCPDEFRNSATHRHFHDPETCPSCAEVQSAQAS